MIIKIRNIDFPVFLTTIIVATIILLVSLGNWQLSRLNQKKNLIESITFSIQNDPIKITYPVQLQAITSNPDKEITSPEESLQIFSKIELAGTFSKNNIFLYGKRSASAEKDGYYLLSPFRIKFDNRLLSKLADTKEMLKAPNDELIILVMRAWVPQSIKTKMDNGEIHLTTPGQGEGEGAGEIIIEAIIMPPEKQQFFAPGNDLDKNIWFHILPEDAASKYGVNVTDFYLRQINATALPEGAKVLNANNLIHIRNDHLEYAITWYLLAASVFICFIVYCRNNSRHPQ